MVASFLQRPLAKTRDGYVVSELIVASSIFCSISLGLLMGFTSMERNYPATTDFTQNHADEMRISDYMAMDLRRAIAMQAASNNELGPSCRWRHRERDPGFRRIAVYPQSDLVIRKQDVNDRGQC